MIFLEGSKTAEKVGDAAAFALLAECMAPAREALGEALVESLGLSWGGEVPLNEDAQEALVVKVEAWMAEASRIAMGYRKAKNDMALWGMVVVGCGLFLAIMMATYAVTFTGAVLVYIGIAGSVYGIIMGLLNLLESTQDFIRKRGEYKTEGAALKQQLDAVKPKIKDPEMLAKVNALSSRLG